MTVDEEREHVIPEDDRVFSPDEIAEEKLINEEYKIWKKNAPFLYDLVVTNAIDWPSLTVEWLPDIDERRQDNKNVTTRRMILGTNTSHSEPNYLNIATVTLPSKTVLPDTRGSTYDDDRTELGGYGGAECRIHVTNKILHEGEVNRARYMPQNPCLIATRTVQGDILVFDYTKHPSMPSANDTCHPELRLQGHKGEGYGLAWNKNKKGHLLSCDNNDIICIWDITQSNKENRNLSPLTSIVGQHGNAIEDVSWHGFHADLFASVGDDARILFWDARSPTTPCDIVTRGHNAEINCLAHSPNNEHLLVTGSADATVALWDLRNLKTKCHSLDVHKDQVLQVCWSPHHETIVASGGADRRINIWDLSRIGMEQDAEDAEDGPPELLFVHGGHTSKLTDFSWDPNEPWMMASTAEDNIVQVWKMAASIYDEEDEDGESCDGESLDKENEATSLEAQIQVERESTTEANISIVEPSLVQNNVSAEGKTVDESAADMEIQIISPEERETKKLHLDL